MYRIKITNRVGTFLTGRRFGTEAKAKSVAMLHKRADKELAGKGYLSLSGRKIQMLNRYSIVKDTPKPKHKAEPVSKSLKGELSKWRR